MPKAGATEAAGLRSAGGAVGCRPGLLPETRYSLMSVGTGRTRLTGLMSRRHGAAYAVSPMGSLSMSLAGARGRSVVVVRPTL